MNDIGKWRRARGGAERHASWWLALVIVLSKTVAEAYTFLPHGSAPLLEACSVAAVLVPAARRHAVEAASTARGGLLVRSDLLVTARLIQNGATVIPLDAGPFVTADAAGTRLLRWLHEYWECRRLEGGEGATCFEWGGCHRRCWWRNSAGRVLFSFDEISMQGIGDSLTAEATYGAAPASAVAELRARCAADRDHPPGPKDLLLRGTLVSFGDALHYCSLRPAAEATAAAGSAPVFFADERARVDPRARPRLTVGPLRPSSQATRRSGTPRAALGELGIDGPGVVAAFDAAGSLGDWAGAVGSLGEWAADRGVAGMLAYGLMHALAIVLCFPATLLFELGAGLVYGLAAGLPLVWAAKALASLLTFGLARAASPLLEASGAAEAARSAIRRQPSLGGVASAVRSDGARLCLLARLSPAPSWLCNYGLPLLGVSLFDYLPASLLASLPAVVTHVYAGTTVGTLVANGVVGGGPAVAGGGQYASLALQGTTLLAGAALARYALGLAAHQGGAADSAAGGGEDDSTGRGGTRLDAAERSSGDIKMCASGEEERASPPQGPQEPSEEIPQGVTLLLGIWRSIKAVAPPLVTGVVSPGDGDKDPGSALFNLVCIRLPFLAACGVLLANVALGGGVAVGGWTWPAQEGGGGAGGAVLDGVWVVVRGLVPY